MHFIGLFMTLNELIWLFPSENLAKKASILSSGKYFSRLVPYELYFISTSALREGLDYSKQHVFDELCNDHNEMRVFYAENIIIYIFFALINLNVVVNGFDFDQKPPIRGSCSANFTAPEGTFSSMNFPDNPYPALANCSWTIEVKIIEAIDSTIYTLLYLSESFKATVI